MKKLFNASIVLLLLILTQTAYADVFYLENEQVFKNEMSVNVARYTGGSQFSIDSSKEDPAFYGSPTSILDYKNDLNMLEMSGKGYFADTGVYAAVKLGVSSSNPTGYMNDNDYINVVNPNGFNDGKSNMDLFLSSRSTTDVSALSFEAVIGKSFQTKNHLRVFDQVHVYGGASYWKEKYNAYGLSYDVSVPYLVLYDDSVKTLEYQTENVMLKLGFKTNTYLNDRISVNMNFDAMPYIKHTGMDNHPLRDDLKQNPSISMNGSGWGYNAGLGLDFDITQNLTVGAYYKYMYMESKGDAQFNFSSGNNVTVDMSDASTSRHAYGAGVSYRF